jgi:sulfonate transport system substrate-binding protein
VIWDPYYAAAELSLGARAIADGTGLAPNVAFYMASRPVAESNSEILKAVLEAVDEDVWIKGTVNSTQSSLRRRSDFRLRSSSVV